MSTVTKPKVVIIGAGFGGLRTVEKLAKQPVDIVLVDRNNYHTFTPLLYQVATSALTPSDIAYPIRGIIRRQKNVRFLLGDVQDIDTDNNQIVLEAHGQTVTEAYDYLVIAVGSVTNYFGNAMIEKYGFGLKDLTDTIAVRNHIIRLFERAVWTDDEEERKALTTLVVVGGGPTGLETAGALYELYNHVLAMEFGNRIQARVILIEALDTLLRPYPEKLQESAKKQLESLGVEVMLNQMVAEVDYDHITLKSGQRIDTHTLVWAAGVKAHPIAATLGVELQRGGRIPVDRNMVVQGLENVFAIGDIAYLTNEEGMPYPQLIPVAQQQGALVAKNIVASVNRQPYQEFEYFDRGMMATIGRSRAVAYPFYKIQLTGYLAWASWLALHLVWLLGVRNRISVFLNWTWNYLTYDRSVRILLDKFYRNETLAQLEREHAKDVEKQNGRHEATEEELEDQYTVMAGS